MLDVLITSRTRRKLLGFLILNPEGRFYLRQLAKEISEAVHTTRIEIIRLKNAGFISETGIGRQKYYQLNPYCPYLDEIKSLVRKLKDSGYKEFNFTDHARKALLEKNLTAVTQALIAKYNPEKIILFGSLANGRVSETTDIDLAIIKDTHKRYFDRIRDVIKLCDYDVGIDFLVYNEEELKEALKINPFVRNEIIKKGKVLYEKTT